MILTWPEDSPWRTRLRSLFDAPFFAQRHVGVKLCVSRLAAISLKQDALSPLFGKTCETRRDENVSPLARQLAAGCLGIDPLMNFEL